MEVNKTTLRDRKLLNFNMLKPVKGDFVLWMYKAWWFKDAFGAEELQLWIKFGPW